MILGALGDVANDLSRMSSIWSILQPRKRSDTVGERILESYLKRGVGKLTRMALVLEPRCGHVRRTRRESSHRGDIYPTRKRRRRPQLSQRPDERNAVAASIFNTVCFALGQSVSSAALGDSRISVFKTH